MKNRHEAEKVIFVKYIIIHWNSSLFLANKDSQGRDLLFHYTYCDRVPGFNLVEYI